VKTVLLLVASNIFMTFAWYGHLRFRQAPLLLLLVILVSWGVAFFEYCFQVPANRWGEFSAAQLKVIQEIVTLGVFVVFSLLYLKEAFRWNYAASFGCMVAAVYFAFRF
jgi:uncharacterized protein (DUF486 family)